jgi:formylglycine-generating enzyme required for sulfatase activity
VRPGTTAPEAEEVRNSIGMRLAPVPAGLFLMGSPRDEEGRGEDEEQHRVHITRPFYLGVYPVTQEEYLRVMANNPSWFALAGSGKGRVEGLDTRRFPVEMVTWMEADEFCRRLSALPAERRAGRGYRLPTEAEWEHACREGGRAAAAFHFGPALSSREANFDGGRPHGGAARGPYLRRTAEVGSYPPNALGLYDLHGNVLEWCADWYGPDHYGRGPAEDPPGPAAGDRRVVRGGAWSYGAATCRSACRTAVAPGTRNGNIGFRVVCEAAR